MINNAICQFLFRYSLKAESQDELTISTVVAMIGSIVGISLALVTIKVIKDYAIVESLLIDVEDEIEESSLSLEFSEASLRITQ